MTPSLAAEIDARSEGRTIVSMFLDTLAATPDQVALRRRDGEGWAELTWADYADAAARVAGGLLAAGIGTGDRVVLMMRNRPEFHIADLGVLLAGATPISIYNSSSAEQVAFLAGHARAHAAIVEDDGYLARVLEARPEVPTLEHVFLIEGAPTGDVRPWSELLAGEPVDLAEAAARSRPEGLATVIYTSGTTGPPKGVQITHRNAVWTVESYRELVGDIRDLRQVSYLPMAHIAERVNSHYLAIASGFQVTTCPEASAIATYCQAVRPQSIFGVPRVWEKMQAAVRAALAADADKARQFQEAVDAALPLQLARRTRDLTDEEQGTLDFLDEAAFRPIRELLGLDQVQFAVSGAAPIAVETLEWYLAIGIPFSEIYGMSENTGPLTWEPWAVRPGTVGRAMPGVELRLEPDGEIVARGGLIFPGYLDSPEQTAEALDADGWLHTGDIGAFDDDGYLRIIDRKKELIITAGGKNISPANLESALRTIPLVGQAAAIGDQRKFVSALLVLDPDAARAWAAAHGRPDATLAELAADPEVVAEVERGVEEAMADFNHAEQVKRFTLLGEEWLPDSEELTPTSKLKRRGIHAKYASQIEAMYQ
jgi:long-chain acyl-CoA synthetase